MCSPATHGCARLDATSTEARVLGNIRLWKEARLPPTAHPPQPSGSFSLELGGDVRQGIQVFNHRISIGGEKTIKYMLSKLKKNAVLPLASFAPRLCCSPLFTQHTMNLWNSLPQGAMIASAYLALSKTREEQITCLNEVEGWTTYGKFLSDLFIWYRTGDVKYFPAW